MTAALQPTDSPSVPRGGGFLFQEAGRTRITTPETLSEEQRMLFRIALQFCREQVLPQADAIEAKTPGLLRSLLAKAGELGLLMVDVPER
ncbi:MAG TPA: acyl-CoA dehydrogenase family protein, partial [Solirubrobacterales bacterium]|nr:acyl-CoA dehydrogenase family protein [Solirubrobacterales bacterium]